MKHLFLLLIFNFSLSISAQEIDPNNSEQAKQIKQSISIFFDGLQTADTIKIKSVCHNEMKLQSILEKNKIGVLSFENNAAFFNSIASIPKNVKVEERILSYNIQIDGSMANVWTPYEFYVNEKLSHIGTNSFTLLLDNNIWKIVHIIDTRRKKI